MSGCAGSDAGAATKGFAIDTVGDTIVVHADNAGEWGSATLTEELRIGSEDGAEEYTFGSLDDVAVGNDGAIYVLDSQANVVRRYDSSGKYIGTFAHAGQGPGELKQPHSIRFLPDGRIVVRDFGNSRMNVYDASGKSLATWSFPGGNFYTGSPLLVDRAGNVYTQIIRERLENHGWHLGLLRIGPDGVVGDTLRDPYDSFEEQTLRAVHVTKNGSSSSASPVPFAAQAISTLSLDGTWVGGISDRYAIEVHQKDGKIRRIERSAPPVAVDPAEKAAEIESVTRGMQRTDPSWRWNAAKPGDVKPFFRGLDVGADGRFWVLRSTPAKKLPPNPDAKPDDKGRMPVERWKETALYDVFEADGHYVGAVTMPEHVYPMVMNGNEVFGSVTDDDGVEYVVKYRVTPASQSDAKPTIKKKPAA